MLTLLADGPDEDAVARVEQVLGSHLERFAQRDGLTVRWVRAGATAVPPSETSQESA